MSTRTRPGRPDGRSEGRDASSANGDGRQRAAPRGSSRWDADGRELWAGGRLVKRFTRPAPLLELLLAAFQELGWPRVLDDPLPGAGGMDPKERLHDAVKRLNACQRPLVVRFRGDGTGQRGRWEWAGPTPAPRRMSPR
jgi:hypothetical protein